MNTVFFDDINSYNDLRLILSKKTIGAPSPKVLSVDIPGGNGALDYTDFFGEIHYYNRALKFEFSIIDNPKNFPDRYSHILNTLNGRKMKIVLSDDKEFYYIGRVVVNDWESEKRIGKVVVEVDTEPYKLKNEITVISIVATEKTVISCKNDRMKVQPTITLSDEAIVTFGNLDIAWKAGTHTSDDILFSEGENIITVTPKGRSTSVSIAYQEGRL